MDLFYKKTKLSDPPAAEEAEALAVSEAIPDQNGSSFTPYGFMNTDVFGYSLVGTADEVLMNRLSCVVACRRMSTGTPLVIGHGRSIQLTNGAAQQLNVVRDPQTLITKTQVK